MNFEEIKERLIECLEAGIEYHNECMYRIEEAQDIKEIKRIIECCLGSTHTTTQYLNEVITENYQGDK